MKLNQKELAEIIAKIYNYLSEKRKARKEAGEDVAEGFTAEEIVGELAAIVGSGEDGESKSGEADEGGTKDNDTDADNGANNAEEGKSNEGQTEIPAEFLATVVKALDALQNGDKKGEAPAPETKSAKP